MTTRPPLITCYTPIYRHAALVGTIGMAFALFASAIPRPKYQNDWPVPKAAQPVISLKTHIDPIKFQLIGKDQFFGSPGMAPDFDWPNPRGAKSFITDQIQCNKNLLSVIIVPFNQNDWSNPKGPQGLQLGFVNTTAYWMLDSLIVCGAYEWPNPNVVKRIIPDQILYNNSLLSAVVFAPFYQNNWPNPFRFRGLAADVYDSNCLLPQPNPFYQTDWFISKGSKANQSGFVYPINFWAFPPFYQNDWFNPQSPRGLQLGFTNTTAFWSITPFNYNDWTNPQRLRGLQIGSFDSLKLELLGLDQFFGAPGQGPVYDWPNPQRPRQRNEYGSIDGYKILLSAALPLPFYLLDWQNPRAARGLTGDQLGYTDPTEFWMLNSLYPFSQIDWNNPQRLRPVGFDQPSYNVNLLSVTFVPFNQINWPNPGRARNLIGDQIGYNLNQFVVTFTPFTQSDWPNPVRVKKLFVEQTSYNLNQFVVTFSPFYQLDWPNPGRARSLIGDQPLYNLDLLITFAPFYQLDWPVPKVQQSSISLKTFSGFNYYTIGQDQFFGPAGKGPSYDWPNPQLPRQRNEFGFIDCYKILIVSGIPVPHNLSDWPNPRGAKGLIADQLGFADRLKLLFYNINFERIAATSFENRQVSVTFESRISTASVENRTATTTVENRTATTTVENRTGSAPEDTEE